MRKSVQQVIVGWGMKRALDDVWKKGILWRISEEKKEERKQESYVR